MVNGFAIDDNGLCFQGQKYITHLKRKQYKPCYHELVGFKFQQFSQKPFKVHLLSP